MNKEKLNITNIAITSAMALGFMGTYSDAGFKERQNTFISKTSEEKLLEISLDEGQNIELIDTSLGYTKVVVTTLNNKKLDALDFSRLNSSRIPNIDLSKAKADIIPESAFKSNEWITNFKFPMGVTSIEAYAFQNCINLIGNLEIPSTVKSIKNYAFYRCEGFTGNLVIPNNVTLLGTSAFYGCSGFNGNLQIGTGLTYLSNNLFTNCSGLTGDLIIPDNITQININNTSNSPFLGCTGLTGDLVVGSGLKTINSYVFRGLDNFKGKLIIKEGVNSIESSSFYGCSGFTGDLIIPNSVTAIGGSAFYDCSGIERIIVATGDEFADSNYRKNIIDALDKTKLNLELSYNFDESKNWIGSMSDIIIVKPNPIVSEGNVIGSPDEEIITEEFVLEISTPYNEDDITIVKDGKYYPLPNLVNGKYIFSDIGIYTLTLKTKLNTVSIIKFEIEDKSISEVKKAVSNAELTKDIIDIEIARELANKLEESVQKEIYQERLNLIIPNIAFDLKEASSNLDLYIKLENMLKLSIDTNSITFEDFSGVSDIVKQNAINLEVSSSLPYKIDAYLATEIQNTTKDKNMNKEILKIKANEKNENEYKSFDDINITPITLLDDQIAGNDIVHGVDLKLEGGKAYEKDNYKTTIKFEVKQK